MSRDCRRSFLHRGSEEINGAIYFAADIENDGRYGGYLRCGAAALPHGGSADQRYGQISSERTVSNGAPLRDKKTRENAHDARARRRRLSLFAFFTKFRINCPPHCLLHPNQ